MKRNIIFFLILAFLGSVPGCTPKKDMTLSDQGFRAISAGNYAEAEKHLAEALSENPDNPYALLNMGVVYQNTDRPEKAIEMYKRVIELNSPAKAAESNIESATGKPLVEIARENMKIIKEQQEQISPPEEEVPAEQPAQVVVEEKKEAVMPQPQETAPAPPPVPEPEQIVVKPAEPREITVEEIEEKPPEPSREFPGGRFYTLQVGAYQNHTLARNHMNALKRQGYESFYEKKIVKKKGALYRVYLNRYGSKKEALGDAKELMQSNVMNDYVLRVMEEPSPSKDHSQKKSPADGYYLHVGSFREKTHASQDVERLKEHGQDATFAGEKAQGETWFRVFIGPYENEGLARRVGETLRKKGVISDFRPVKRQ